MTINSVQDAYNYYLKYDEESRVKRNKSHLVEFVLSMNAIEKYITPDSCVIDVGCGTGNYSMPLAPKCREILATDLMDNLLDVLRKKIETEGLSNISCLCANALDLPELVDKKYDLILCMGPLYHLNDTEIRRQCYANLKKIATPNATFIFTYLTTKAPFSAVLKGKIKMSTFFDLHKNDTYYKGAFYFTSPTFMEKEMHENAFQIVEHVATDPICSLCFEPINALSDENYQDFLETVIHNNAHSCLLNLSSHNMIVAKSAD